MGRRHQNGQCDGGMSHVDAALPQRHRSVMSRRIEIKRAALRQRISSLCHP